MSPTLTFLVAINYPFSKRWNQHLLHSSRWIICVDTSIYTSFAPIWSSCNQLIQTHNNWPKILLILGTPTPRNRNNEYHSLSFFSTLNLLYFMRVDRFLDQMYPKYRYPCIYITSPNYRIGGLFQSPGSLSAGTSVVCRRNLVVKSSQDLIFFTISFFFSVNELYIWGVQFPILLFVNLSHHGCIQGMNFTTSWGNTKDHWVWAPYPRIPSANDHDVPICFDSEILTPVLVIVATWY